MWKKYVYAQRLCLRTKSENILGRAYLTRLAEINLFCFLFTVNFLPCNQTTLALLALFVLTIEHCVHQRCIERNSLCFTPENGLLVFLVTGYI